MPLTVRWGNDLNALADDLFARLAGPPVPSPDLVFARRDCVVVPNRIQQAWLQQRFLLDSAAAPSGLPRVLALCDFPLLAFFVNDWLYRMAAGPDAGRPDPEQHPFSVKSMRWRIYAFLMDDALEEPFAPLRTYVHRNDARDPRKCFKLAGRLASLMDQYQTYRPDRVRAWETCGDDALAPDERWQRALWLHLVEGRENDTYLAALRAMDRNLRNAHPEHAYRRVFVFAPAMMPGAHLAFFRALGELLPVDFYMLNPSREDWFDRLSLRSAIRDGTSLERMADPENLADLKHPLLSAYARGARDLAAGAVDLTGGQIEEAFAEANDNTVLGFLRDGMLRCDPSLAPLPPPPLAAPIELHRCHGKMREVEILRDQLLRAFDDDRSLEPRHVQVQAADLNAYAPYIDAVFASANPNAPAAIPYVLADRIAGGENSSAWAFRQLLELSDSRFAAPDVVDLLRCPGVARKFGFEPADVDGVAAWIARAGIRWGRDPAHRKAVSHAAFEPQTTWRHGLDRLLLGYALGGGDDAPPLGGVLPCDCAEGREAVLLGQLAAFYSRLADVAESSIARRPVAEWAERIGQWIDDFFASDNASYADVLPLKSAVRLLAGSAQTAGFAEPVPIAVVRDFLAGHLSQTTGGADQTRNAVVFSSLRPGSSAPRRIHALLGMGEGLFPRAEARPAYDLMRNPRKMGDRSSSIEDRMAFLEVLLNAKQRLLILYPAFSEEDNAPLGESVVVRELADYLALRVGNAGIVATSHHVQSFHPDYFAGASPALFSYSAANCDAAKALVAAANAAPAAPHAAPFAPPLDVALDDLLEFFKNPSKFYFRHVAGASVAPREDAALDDAEPFDPSHLAKADVRKQIVKAILDGTDPAALRDACLADGLVPLGEWGRRWFEDSAQNVAALLDHLIEETTLRDLLVLQANADESPIDVSIHVAGQSVRLYGRAHLFAHKGSKKTVVFRCSSATDSASLGAWISHLAACAAGLEPCSILAQGKKVADLKPQAFDPLPAAEAAGHLAELLCAFFDGHRAPLPFTPPAAMAYAQASLKAPETAVQAAIKKWFSQPRQPAYDGDRDAHYAMAFGPQGFFESPLLDSFKRWADRIALPLAERLADAKDTKAKKKK
jgi:exodeoxyribonuclease V gamma subunit